MPNDVQTMMHWIRIMLLVTAVCVTVFPVLYLFSPWYRSHLGRAVMLLSMSIAFAVDFSAYAQFGPVTDNIQWLFGINLGIFTFISLSSLYLSATLLYYNFFRTNLENEDDHQQAFPQ